MFVTRDASGLSTQQMSTDLADGWATDAEQTLLDLVDRPTLGDASAADVDQMMTRLRARADPERAHHLALDQRKSSAARRLLSQEDA